MKETRVLKGLIRRLVNECIIEERFGKRVGEQPACVGVCDERGDVIDEMYPGDPIDLGEADEEDTTIDEVTPPGKEKLVRALKKDPNVDNPWAVAWSVHNREKKKKTA